MGNKFITNKKEDEPLVERIKKFTQKSAKLDFLIGYFFFSGFSEISKDLKDKHLRILVGMDADVDINNCIVEYTTVRGNKGNTDSKQTTRLKYFDTLKKAINKSDSLDSQQIEESYKVFRDKLNNGTLEVRKTKDPNHAKMYLFDFEDKDESKVIVGSSNFSFQGFKGRNEVNVLLKDDHDFEDGEEIFEELWKSSIPLVDSSTKDEFITDVLEHTWLELLPNPYLMYVKVLYEYFKVTNDYIKTPKELTHDRINQFFDVSYQVDAIRDGILKIKKYSGIIVADVVGLGKSIIASAIAANLDKRCIIISPPHLKSQWEDYAADFGLRGCKVYTSGKIESAANENKGNECVVIIDEAHRYRNENTEDYGFLHQLCVGKQVILLSATPFNNKPEDIFSLIKLFQIPAHSNIQTVNNLGDQMEQLVLQYKKLKQENRNKKSTEKEFAKKSNELAEQIRNILNPVVIRRTRVDLEKLIKYKSDLQAQKILFSEVKPPVSKTYKLGSLSGLYSDTLLKLTSNNSASGTGFSGARYKPLTYLKKSSNNKNEIDKSLIKKYSVHFDDVENFAAGQRNMAEFMKQLLVRRFESSKYSFISSIKNILKSMEKLKTYYTAFNRIPMDKKNVLPDVDALQASLDDNSNSLFSEDEFFDCATAKEREKGVWFIDKNDISDDFIKDLNADIDLLKSFLTNWDKEKDSDPKLDAIEKEIKDSIKEEPNRKIIIFTEFSDTADYLQEQFEKRKIRSMKYSSKVASKSGRDAIRQNFDAGYNENEQTNNFDVLVATDAISEGYSLHRAGTIYNYDIPYNPTRVIQRVGRINRINKKVFDTLYIYNFFPTITGEDISHTKEISTFKMKLFQAILGADTKILTDDETIDGYLGKQFTEEENSSNSISWDVEFRNELYKIEKDEKDILEKAKNLPLRCRIARKNVHLKSPKTNEVQESLLKDFAEKGVLLFSKKGDAYRFCFTAQDGSTIMVSPEQALALFKANKTEEGFKVSDQFYPLYERAKNENGVVRSSKQKSKTVLEALQNIAMLLKLEKNNDNKEYLETLRNELSLDSIPLYYTKQIAKLKMKNVNAVADIKSILPDSYLEAIKEKDSKIGNEPETILLAEELI